jgi:hypothetical protein
LIARYFETGAETHQALLRFPNRYHAAGGGST